MWGLIIGRVHAHAFSESITQSNRPPVLLEEVAECLVGQILQPSRGSEGKLVQGVPGLGIEFNAAADW